MGGWLDACIGAPDVAGGKSVIVDSLLVLLNGACEPNKAEAVGLSSSSNREETALLVLPPNSEDLPAFAATGAVAAGALGAFGTSSSLSAATVESLFLLLSVAFEADNAEASELSSSSKRDETLLLVPGGVERLLECPGMHHVVFPKTWKSEPSP